MITEDYVSFETAKLLKEKGFDEECRAFYVKSKECGIELFHAKEPYNYNNNVNPCTSAPTLQMAMKWLREVHSKSIEIRSQGLKATSIGWIVEIYNLANQDEEFHHPYTFPTYEEACETAIRYSLENLI